MQSAVSLQAVDVDDNLYTVECYVLGLAQQN